MFQPSRHVIQLASYPPLEWLAPFLSDARRRARMLRASMPRSLPWQPDQARGTPAEAVSPPSTGI